MKANLYWSVGFLVLGAVVGSVRWVNGEPKRASPTPEHASPASATPERRTETFHPPQRADPQAENSPKAEARLRALAEVNGCLRRPIRVRLIEFDKMNDDFVAVYDVSASEKALLAAAIAKAKGRIAELAAKYAVITRGADDIFRISIPAFPEAGGAVFDEFCRSVRAVLGEERYALYQVNGEEADSSSFGGFGVGVTMIFVRGPGAHHDRQYSISNADAPDGAPMGLVVSDQSMLSDQYPELAQRMVAEGWWQLPAEP